LEITLFIMFISSSQLFQFTEAGTKLLNVLRQYLQIRDKSVSIKSACFDLTMESFMLHFQDRYIIRI
jgi:hypothetical protein